MFTKQRRNYWKESKTETTKLKQASLKPSRLAKISTLPPEPQKQYDKRLRLKSTLKSNPTKSIPLSCHPKAFITETGEIQAQEMAKAGDNDPSKKRYSTWNQEWLDKELIRRAGKSWRLDQKFKTQMPRNQTETKWQFVKTQEAMIISGRE